MFPLLPDLMRTSVFIVAGICLTSTSCGWWISSAELDGVQVAESDTVDPVDTGDSLGSPVCVKLLAVEGLSVTSDVWVFQRVYLTFDDKVSPSDLKFEVASATGEGITEELLRFPGTFQDDRVHVVQPPFSGWSAAERQTLKVSWGEECSQEVEFSVQPPPSSSVIGLEGGQTQLVMPMEGTVYPPGLPLRPDQLVSGILFQADETWDASREPASTTTATSDDAVQHPCSPAFLRYSGDVVENDHIWLSITDYPFELAGSLTKLESGALDVTFRDAGLHVNRIELSIPTADVPSVDLCAYTTCRICPSGKECALIWVEHLTPTPVDTSLGQPEVTCANDQDGVCDGYCEGTTP